MARVARSLSLRSARAVMLCTLAVTLLAGPSAAFTFTTIDVSGAILTAAFGINKAGQIVGYYLDSDAVPHGFLRQPDGSMTAIDAPGAPCGTYALGINNAGKIVGLFDDCSVEHAFRLAGGTFTTIDVPDATATEALGITGGRIVGDYTDAGGTTHGFRLVRGTFTTIDVPGAAATLATGINKAGQIVGVYTDADANAHGFLATP